MQDYMHICMHMRACFPVRVCVNKIFQNWNWFLRTSHFYYWQKPVDFHRDCDDGALCHKNYTHGSCLAECLIPAHHYSDVIKSAMTSQITDVSIACSTVGSGADQRKHQSSESLAFVWGNHRWPINSPHKRPVTRKRFPFDDVIMFADILHLMR